MKRERAVFQGSRLYRQSMEGSLRLLAELSDDHMPFSNEIEAVSNGGSIVIASNDDGAKWVATAQRLAEDVCHQISPYIGVPVLLQAIIGQYYERNAGKSTPLGMYLKHTLELVAGSLFTSRQAHSKSIRSLVKGVRATALLNQLQGYAFIFEEFSSSGESISLSPTEITTTEHLHHILRHYRKPTPPHSRFMRTLSSTKKAIWSDPNKALGAVERVLQGEPPQNQELFDRTLFRAFSDREPKEFWAGIWARLNLAIYSNAIRSQVTNNVNSISILQPFAAPVPERIDPTLLQDAMHQLFWDHIWYPRMVNALPTHLIGERPAVRVSNTPKLYATSPLLVGDSLNWFIEASIVPYAGSGVFGLSDKVFKDLVSGPFEDSVIEVFRSHGFSAGRVSEKAVWQTQSKHVVLRNRNDERMPGEIDLLAFHRASQTVVIVECKVISVPFHGNAMRNISRKLGDSDEEKFHSKLDQKVRWVKDAEPFDQIPDENYVAFIALDVKMRWVPSGKYPVIDFQDLKDFMSRADPVDEIRELCEKH